MSTKIFWHKNYRTRTSIVKDIVEGWVVYFFATQCVMLLHVICLLMNDYITFTDDSVQSSYRTAELVNSEHVADLPHTQTNRSLLYSVFLLT